MVDQAIQYLIEIIDNLLPIIESHQPLSDMQVLELSLHLLLDDILVVSIDNLAITVLAVQETTKLKLFKEGCHVLELRQ